MNNMDNIVLGFIDILYRKPVIGIISSIFTASISTADLLQTSAIILGVFIAVITLITKALEMIDRIRTNREHRADIERQHRVRNKPKLNKRT